MLFRLRSALAIALAVIGLWFAGAGLAYAEEARSHTVQAGETLWDIALHYGTSVEALQEANDLDNADFLRIGQVLTLPGSLMAPSEAYYQVQPGDTLLAIAYRYGVSLEELISRNNLSDPDSLQIGQKVLLPKGTSIPSSPPNQASIYIVKSGDTLWDIAQETGIALRTLMQANALGEGDLLQVGQKLVLPGLAPSAPMSTAIPKPASPPPAATKAGRIVELARAQLGVPYRWGGTGPSGFDCSGLVQFVLSQVGISVGHDAQAIFQAVREISPEELAPGDLVFFVNTYQPGLSHVGIFIGDSLFIHSPYPGTLVRAEPMDNPYYQERFYAAGRV